MGLNDDESTAMGVRSQPLLITLSVKPKTCDGGGDDGEGKRVVCVAESPGKENCRFLKLQASVSFQAVTFSLISGSSLLSQCSHVIPIPPSLPRLGLVSRTDLNLRRTFCYISTMPP